MQRGIALTLTLTAIHHPSHTTIFSPLLRSLIAEFSHDPYSLQRNPSLIHTDSDDPSLIRFPCMIASSSKDCRNRTNRISAFSAVAQIQPGNQALFS